MLLLLNLVRAMTSYLSMICILLLTTLHLASCYVEAFYYVTKDEQ